MSNKHEVHNLIILDESGSMESIKRPTIQGFNELVQTIKGIQKEYPEQEHFISLVSFNGLGQKILHFMDPVSQLEMIDDKKYCPDASTPLFDAMGSSITRLKKALEGKKAFNVLVTVLTDGEENASLEYTGHSIKSLVEDLKSHGWTFTYIGTDHDVEKIAMSISITNTMSFEKSDEGLKGMFMKESQARARYSKKIREQKETSEDFYEEKQDTVS